MVSRSGDVITVHQDPALLDAALAQGIFDFRCDIDRPAAGGQVEPEFLAIGFHEISLGIDWNLFKPIIFHMDEEKMSRDILLCTMNFTFIL